MTVRRAMPLLFLVVLAAMTVRLVTTLADPGVDDGGYLDFRDAIHAPVAALLDGVNPYDADEFRAHDAEIGQTFPVYSPHHLLLALPLGVLPRTAAGALWWALNVALLLVLANFVVQRVRSEWGLAGVFGIAAITLVSNPGRFNFLTGQPTLPIVLGAYLAFTSPNRWLAGAGTALALIKPQIGIPVLVLLAAGGRARAAVDGIGLAALLSAPIVVTLIVIEDGAGNLISVVGDNLDNSLTGTDAASSFRIDLLGSLIRETDVQSGALATLLVFAGLVAVGAWLLRRWGRIDGVAMSVVGLITLLATFHLPYDELLLVWPIAGLAAASRHLGSWSRWAIGGMVGAAFNPLTVLVFDIGDGFDSVTTLLLVIALAAMAVGIVRQPATPAPAGREAM